MNGNPNSKQWSPLGKFVWAFAIVGVLIVTKWWIGVVIFGAASIAVLGLAVLVTRGGKGKSAAREDEALDDVMRAWKEQAR